MSSFDKTGTLTTNRIQLRQIIPIDHEEDEVRQRAGDFVASTGRVNRTADAIAEACPGQAQAVAVEIPFSSEYKWSGATFANGAMVPGSIVLGAPEVLLPCVDDGHLLQRHTDT